MPVRFFASLQRRALELQAFSLPRRRFFLPLIGIRSLLRTGNPTPQAPSGFTRVPDGARAISRLNMGAAVIRLSPS